MKKKTPKYKKCNHYWICSASTFCTAHEHKCRLCGQVAEIGYITHANFDGK